MRTPVSQQDFEAEIAGDHGSYRNELHVEQVSPPHRVPRAAYLVVRADRLADAEAHFAALDDAILNMVKLVDGLALRTGGSAAYFRGLPGRRLVEIHHHSDRTYAGYANIYRAIRDVAPLVEDARFFISEDYDEWVDEYRIEDGVLWFERGWAADEYAEALRAYFVDRARADRGDRELAAFAAWCMADHAGYCIDNIERGTRRGKEHRDYADRARAALEIAHELDGGCARAFAERGRLLVIDGDREAGGADLARAAALDATAESWLAATLAALATGAAAATQDRLTALLAFAPSHKAGLQLRGLLAYRAGDRAAARAAFSAALAIPGNPDADALFRAGVAGELLDAWTQVLEDGIGDADRVTLARDLLAWGHVFRILHAHGRDPNRSKQRARDLLDRARRLDELGGDVLYELGLLDGDRSPWFAQILEVNPDHVGALGKLGRAAHEAADYDRAIDLLARAVDVSERRKTGSYERQVNANYLLDAHYRRAVQVIDRVMAKLPAVDEALLAEAEAFADRAIAHYAKVGYSGEHFEGPLLAKGDVASLRGDHARALEHYDAALARQPASPYALSARASALNNLGRVDEALACVDRSLAGKDDLWHAHYVKACVLAKQGGDRKAIYKLLRHVLKLAPERRALIAVEPDFTALRGERTFQQLIR